MDIKTLKSSSWYRLIKVIYIIAYVLAVVFFALALLAGVIEFLQYGNFIDFSNGIFMGIFEFAFAIIFLWLIKRIFFYVLTGVWLPYKK